MTGAASGIGEALAAALAARLCLAHPAADVDTLVVDLADAEATQRAAEQIAAGHPDLTLLVNNAGSRWAGASTRSPWRSSSGCRRSTCARWSG
ncbi:hypothetical protein SAMN05661080_01417 [Modestobacter sp. DSM 44400]|uniref:hypothetical protein n=1 Tax=Modestobacter sp. DSM 44400 TaxID=1550230 RepID=UPI000896F48D|nr:hypothetical protein [Modestobacter sp. DSM 44400]SDX84166.1 hypothetical protein SAMN05661080_01417 [Modestobacter sp. DSM 44400]